jgi:hypothetical protein
MNKLILFFITSLIVLSGCQKPEIQKNSATQLESMQSTSPNNQQKIYAEPASSDSPPPPPIIMEAIGPNKATQ